MTFVAFWSPGVFTATLDYCDAAGWGQDGPGPDGGDDDPGEDPAPPTTGPGPRALRAGNPPPRVKTEE
jgi:hypothetical protein